MFLLSQTSRIITRISFKSQKVFVLINVTKKALIRAKFKKYVYILWK